MLRPHALKLVVIAVLLILAHSLDATDPFYDTPTVVQHDPDTGRYYRVAASTP